MFPAATRRDFLQTMLGAAALSLPAVVSGQTPSSARPTLAATSLTDTLTLVSGGGGNVVVLEGDDGLLLVNGGAAEHAAALLALIDERFGGKRVRTLFNTDWHPHHTGANGPLARTGARIVAHEHTRQYLGAEIVVDWQERTYMPLPAPALPTETFYTQGTLAFARETVRYGHLGQAHTDGDIYVFFPSANVLVAGDVLAVDAYPIADYTTGGWLGGLAAATKTLLDLTTPGTRIVPGAGPVRTRDDLQAQHDMLVAMRDRLGKMMRQGLSAREMLAAGATREFDARWGDPTLFVSTAYRGLWLHVRELGGIV